LHELKIIRRELELSGDSPPCCLTFKEKNIIECSQFTFPREEFLKQCKKCKENIKNILNSMGLLKNPEKFKCRACGEIYNCDQFYQPCPKCGAPWTETHVLLFQEP
jgi:hypothetical protein